MPARIERYQTETGHVHGKHGKIWYQRFGKPGDEALVFLHGGPGGTHFGATSIRSISKVIPFLLYDQTGSGLSDVPKNLNYAKPEYFARELETLRTAIGINKLHIIGHSWGAVPALQYWKAFGKNVLSLIFSGPLISTRVWEKDAKLLLTRLPKRHREAMVAADESGDYTNQAYKDADKFFWTHHVYRKKTKPRGWSLGGSNANIYNTLWGPSEFCCTGTLKKYHGEPLLKTITVPTLFMCGEHDEARPETMKRFAAQVPKGQVAVLKGCSHISYVENPALYIKTLRKFLGR